LGCQDSAHLGNDILIRKDILVSHLKEDEEEWLNLDIIEPEQLLQLLKQYQERDMEAYPISTQ
jgi:putative SOS response-associated peptidase YedK